jgi:hypothetical protein
LGAAVSLGEATKDQERIDSLLVSYRAGS